LGEDFGEPSLPKVTADFQVRPFGAADVPQLLELMQGLAAFEGYVEQFAVTAPELVANGLEGARFGAFVAADPRHRLLGMAVHYRIPWTSDLKPTLVLKELFVAERTRGHGVGRALMAAVVGEARRIGAPRLKWTVLPGNAAARQFYSAQGGRVESEWEPWILELDGVGVDHPESNAGHVTSRHEHG
jgi:GNAT superfamily N-acetyltransferase